MKRKMAIIAALVMALSTLVFVNPPKVQAASSSKIGIVMPTNSESRWPMAYKQFKAVDQSLQILYSDNNPATEKTNVETLVNKGCKVIIICPFDSKAAAAEADYAKSKGATVIAYDRMIMTTKAVDYYVTFDSIAVGQAQGQYLVDMAKGKGKGLHLYLYCGATTDDNAFTFFTGSWKALQPKIADGTFIVENSPQAVALKDKATLTRSEESSIIDSLSTQWDPPTAKNIAQANLAKLSTPAKGNVYVLCPNDDTSRAITDTFRADPAIKTMYSTGQDFTKASIQYIIDGKQGMTVAKLDKYLVQDSMKIANLIVAGKKPGINIIKQQYNNGAKMVPSTLDKITTVTKSNVKDIIHQSWLYKVSDFQNLK
jgi:putative multiple sugar transport system substrate-binding protein